MLLRRTDWLRDTAHPQHSDTVCTVVKNTGMSCGFLSSSDMRRETCFFFWHQVPSITSIMTLYGFVRNGQRVLKIMQPSSAYRYKTTLHGNAMFCTDLQNRRILDGGGRRLFGLSRIWRKVRPSNMKVWFGSGIQMADVWCCAPFQLFGRKCSLLPQCNMGMDGPYIVSFVAVLI